MSWNIKTPGDYINGPLTVAGNTTITGDLTVDTSTLKVDSTNNRVGIGTASPTAALHVNLAEVSSAAGTSAIIANTTGGGNRIAALRLSNLSNQWNIRAYGAVTDDLRIGAGSTGSEVDYLAIGNTGNVNVALGNVVMATSGKGIDFSATASGSGTMTSELLNDYEEGTWVPSVGGTATYTLRSGSYVKVGRLVTVSWDMEILLIGTGDISGIISLPFVVGTATSPANQVGYGATGFFNVLATTVYSMSFYAAANTSIIYAMTKNSLSAGNSVNTAIYGNGTRVQGSLTYMTNS
jgi:hypothetical protein